MAEFGVESAGLESPVGDAEGAVPMLGCGVVAVGGVGVIVLDPQAVAITATISKSDTSRRKCRLFMAPIVAGKVAPERSRRRSIPHAQYLCVALCAFLNLLIYTSFMHRV